MKHCRKAVLLWIVMVVSPVIMCAKAQEDLRKWQRHKIAGAFYINISGDLCLGTGDLHGRDNVLEKRFYTTLHYAFDDIWIPRQDELQELLHPFSVEKYLKEFYEHCIDNYQEYDSMEQLWLTYFMKKKYGKTWDEVSEEWVKEEDETF